MRYPNLPCIEVLNTNSAFPIEKCMVPTQLMAKTIDNEIMNDLVTDVLKFSTLRPDARLKSIREGFQVGLHSLSLAPSMHLNCDTVA